MKLKFTFLLLVFVIFTACDKDDDGKTYQVKYEVENHLSVNSHIKITYNKNDNTNVVDAPLAPGQKWEISYTGNSGEQTLLSCLVINDSANFDLRIFVDQVIFSQDNGYCQDVCDTLEVMISKTLD